MKVLHVLNLSIPDLTGYSIRSKYIVEFQKELGLSPIVVTSPKYPRLIQYEEIGGIPYYRAYSEPDNLEKLTLKVPFIREQTIMWNLQRTIEKVARSTRVDLIHAHSPSLCGIPASKVARRLNIPFIYEVRALWEDAAVDQKRFSEGSLKYFLSKKVEQRLFDRAHAIICICEGLRKELSYRTDKGKIFVIENGVDTEKFVSRQKSKRVIERYELQSKVVVGFIGSFFAFEGLQDLILSVPEVIKSVNNVLSLIVGGGVEEENVRELAANLGVLNNQVIFTGRVPHEEILDYYSVMDILVYPRVSKRITELVTPLKPLEAMSMEKAVIASDVGGLRELIEDNVTGVLFKAGDYKNLAKKIVGLAINNEQRIMLGKNARLKMVQQRDWKYIVSRYRNIYNFAFERTK